jgi:hypothetical protein
MTSLYSRLKNLDYSHQYDAWMPYFACFPVGRLIIKDSGFLEPTLCAHASKQLWFVPSRCLATEADTIWKQKFFSHWHGQILIVTALYEGDPNISGIWIFRTNET